MGNIARYLRPVGPPASPPRLRDLVAGLWSRLAKSVYGPFAFGALVRGSVVRLGPGGLALSLRFLSPLLLLLRL